MSILVLLAVLGAAFLHAGWNALIKTGASQITAMTILALAQGVGGLVMGVWLGFPPAHVWPWLLASGVLHSAYTLALAHAYAVGDLSRVYPIARGLAPLIVLVLGPLALDERLQMTETLGIVVLGVGVMGMARGVARAGERVVLIPFAVASAMATAGYSIVDGLGARAWGAPAAFVAWMFAVDIAIYLPVILWLKGRGVLRAAPRDWALGSLAAAASFAAYAIAVWAMTRAPIALVTGLRETSILFAVALGWLVFGDRMTAGKAASALAIVCGVALTRL